MFRNWAIENFPFLEDDFDALTDYELFCKICGYVIGYSKDNEEMKKKIAELEHYFDTLDVQEEINNKLDEMASDGTLATIINQEIFTELDNKTKYITPESFGAKGDGVTDDTDAFNDMIDYIDSIVSLEPVDSYKDYSMIRIIFSGKYAISSPIVFSNTYGLVLNKLSLIATDDFSGDYLLGFNGNQKEVTIDNCILNGNLHVNKCLFIDDYVLVFRIVNSHITRFNQYGIYANDDKGHELMISKCKINQVEWNERENLNNLVDSGIGLYLGTERYDNTICENVINYCKDYTLVVKSGSNFFSNNHFYWKDVKIDGFKNFIQGCYFDGVQLSIMGDNYIDGCYFGSDTGRAFIKINETYSNSWRSELIRITNSLFHNKGEAGSIANDIIFDSSWEDHESEFTCETIGNTFYAVDGFMYRSGYSYYPEQWKSNRWTGANSFGEEGSCRIGDLLIQYGTISESGTVTFPIEFALAPFIVNLEKHAQSSHDPYATDVTTTGFTANSIDVSTNWVAIGRMNA